MKRPTGKVMLAITLLTVVGSSFAFLPLPIFASNSTTSTAPPWGFNGAYVIYSYSLNYNGSQTTAQVTATLSNVDLSTETYNFTITCIGTFCSMLGGPSGGQSNGTDSFDSPIFPVVNMSQLKSLNEGQGTGGLTGSVTSNTTVTVPAGTIRVDKVVTNTETLWIDTESGLFIQFFVTIPSSTQGTSESLRVQLLATNIPTTASSNLPFGVLIVALVVVAACAVSMAGGSALRGIRKVPDGQHGESEVGVINTSVL